MTSKAMAIGAKERNRRRRGKAKRAAKVVKKAVRTEGQMWRAGSPDEFVGPVYRFEPKARVA